MERSLTLRPAKPRPFVCFKPETIGCPDWRHRKSEQTFPTATLGRVAEDRQASDLISTLLRAGLLAPLGADEDRVQRLRDAAVSLTSKLMDEGRPMGPSVLLALADDRTNPNSDALGVVDSELLLVWESARNAFASTPVELLRAIGLQAVTDAANTDSGLRAALWYIGRTIAERVPGDGWAPHVSAALAAQAAAVRASIEEVWVPSPPEAALRMPAMPARQAMDPGETRALAIAKEAPEDFQGWATAIAPQFADIVNDLATYAAGAADKADERGDARLRDVVTALGDKLRAAVAAQEQAVRAVVLRSELLWWRQTAMSRSTGVPFAQLPDTASIAISASADLHEMMPDVTPVAVEHLLADLVGTLTNNEGVTTDALREAARSHPALPPEAVDWGSGLLVHAVVTDHDPSPCVAETMPAAAAAVIMFRELQAMRLVAG